MRNLFKKTLKIPSGVWLTAQPGIVLLVHSGIPCALKSDLAREVSKQLVRFADLADSIDKANKEVVNVPLQSPNNITV